MKARILLVEDEKHLRDIIKLNLELESYEVVTADTGSAAMQQIEQAYFDLIILDLMLPEIPGLDILKSFRIRHNTPVIIISAKDTSTDRIEGLKTGADDYLPKPFEIEELILRIEKLLMRNQSESNLSSDIFEFDNYKINFKSYQIERDGQIISLGAKETQILKMLINHRNEVLTRQDILKGVWGYDVFPSTRTVDNFIASLRKSLEVNPKRPKYIKSVHGIGYRFDYQ